MSESTEGRTHAQADAHEVDRPDPPRFYAHAALTALLSGVFALIWYVLYVRLDDLIWDSEYVATIGWVGPVLILGLSLAVGLAVRYLQAPTSIEGSMLDELTGDPTRIRWRQLPVTVVQSLISLLAGAVVGPEGALGRFAGQIAEWYSERLRVPAAMRGRLVFAAAAAAYNGLLANPLFTAVLGADIARRSPAVWSAIPSNLLGGAIGYALFTVLGGAGIADFLDLGPIPEVAFADLLWAVLFAVVGMFLAVVGAVGMQVAQAGFGRLANRPVERALVAGVIFSVVWIVAPVLLFSGERQIRDIVADPDAYGFWLLLLLAIAKLALLAVSFKSGFMGGPTFPVIFAATSVALAIDSVLPDVGLVFIEAGVLAGALMTLFRTPLMVILLTGFFLSANTDLMTLIVISVVTVVALLPVVQASMERTSARRRSH